MRRNKIMYEFDSLAGIIVQDLDIELLCIVIELEKGFLNATLHCKTS